MTDAVVHTRIKKVQHAAITDVEDVVATEEPLEIRLVYGPSHNRRQQSISITMRTPGNDEELAAGFLFTEGIISSYSGITGIHAQHNEDQSIATVQLQENVIPALGAARRSFAATAACGVCGKTDLAAIHTGVNVSSAAAVALTSADIICRLPAALQQEQAVFNTTGGLHAAALFDAAGRLQLLREDIGRHNAVDKIIGAALQAPLLPLSSCLLLLSGRAGFELIQKAAMANIPLIAAVGAPSSLAIKMAAAWNITLIGFLRGEKFNIYTGAERITCK
ncbi:formate dehydrogenase accessory sulfurtransferase FdhD [Chitinophaga vietnamensis]|uniref:formate dehydrogenase accessory sulfurtransferase FdhD n=1 Tax=Chitinophaga vietnamensis TaxID=2593957 RepID=UPI001177FB2C|nr:formate dehydrogenase accessory sulfurtransferase FdhD [Chitinophaga vietnamensis]